MSAPTPLIATYRLQLTPSFGFSRAAELVPYLADLGISHLYLSPIFEARPGSTHGYDQTDPTRIREELGGLSVFEHLSARAHDAGLGILLDIVPNHMAAHHANPWWIGLLRRGRGSEFDRFFDVSWDEAGGRVVLPVLGEPLTACVKAGQLTLELSSPIGPAIRYFDKRFPLRDDLPLPNTTVSPEEVATVLSQQHYELAFWRDGLTRINYRRFFDIADLAGLRVEDPRVFDSVHAATLDLITRGHVDALRTDHIDGLLDPLAYLRRLRAAVAAASPHHVPIFVEKILAADESLPPDWPIDGATGYEFLAAVGQLAAPRTSIEHFHEHSASTPAPKFQSLANACKLEVARTLLAPELHRVAVQLAACAASAGFPLETPALREVVAALSAAIRPYRTYVDTAGASETDTRTIRQAAARSQADPAALGVLTELLTLSGPFAKQTLRAQAIAAIQRWQQFTGPLAAKGVEDTALYRDSACPWLTDVGSEPVPREWPVARIAALRAPHPLSLNATDTHDSKRSEDVRARLAALAHFPETWIHVLERYRAHAQRHDPQLFEADEARLLQTAFATLPPEGPDQDLAARIKAYIVKAAREAKLGTTWTKPDRSYESLCEQAVDRLLFAPGLSDLRADLVSLASATGPLAARLSIAAVALKTLFPGTPDFYQGAEWPTIALVDPDNRRPVDFASRSDMLRQIETAWRADPAAAAASFFADEQSAAAKLYATWRFLRIRRDLLRRGPIQLASSEMSAAAWEWSIVAGAARCNLRFELHPPVAPHASNSARGMNQLTASADSVHGWASVHINGVAALW